jgi:hypothetical protein
MTIWEYQHLIVRRLIQWSLFSLGVGGILLLGSRFWRQMGKQFVGWALIDLAIAYFGLRISDQRRAALPDPEAPAAIERETGDLRRLLEASVLIDLIGVFAGRSLLRRGLSGTGWGVLIQSSFLFFFDLFHAGRVPGARRKSS